jgi:TIR domain
MTAIFISHRSSDNAEVGALRRWLAEQGHEQLFLDFDPADGIPAGVDWEQQLYRELRRCQALLIVLTPAWLASIWCRNELAIAREKGKAIFVVRAAPCPDGPLIPAIQEVDLTLNREAALAKLARGLREHGLDPASAFDWKPDRPIYPGLATFDVDDAAIFFGRSIATGGLNDGTVKIWQWREGRVVQTHPVEVRRNVSTTLRQPSVEFKLGFLEFSSVN